MFVSVIELKQACRTLSVRATSQGKPGLARRFNMALVHPLTQEAEWVCSVADELLEDEAAGPLLRRELGFDAAA